MDVMEHNTDRAMAAFTWPRLGTPVLRAGAAMALLQAPWLAAIGSEKLNTHRYCKRRVGCEGKKEARELDAREVMGIEVSTVLYRGNSDGNRDQNLRETVRERAGIVVGMSGWEWGRMPPAVSFIVPADGGDS
ncbi:hypothetical protein M758_8G100900 [Ceratodon purpureus]|nr:hypothetical protein M758_8G100900 [Ceratodon purpureus]